MITLAKRMISAVGWALLITMVYVAVVVGLVIRSFQEDANDNARPD